MSPWNVRLTQPPCDTCFALHSLRRDVHFILITSMAFRNLGVSYCFFGNKLVIRSAPEIRRSLKRKILLRSTFNVRRPAAAGYSIEGGSFECVARAVVGWDFSFTAIYDSRPYMTAGHIWQQVISMQKEQRRFLCTPRFFLREHSSESACMKKKKRNLVETVRMYF